MEHPADRIRRYWKRCNDVDVVFDWERPPKSSDWHRFADPKIRVTGFWYRLDKPHAHWRFVPNEYADLRCCERCGRWASSRVVKTRNDVYGWNHLDEGDWQIYRNSGELCMACYNKIRPLVDLKHELAGVNQYIRLIERTARKIKNGHYDRGVSRVAGRHDGAAKERRHNAADCGGGCKSGTASQHLPSG